MDDPRLVDRLQRGGQAAAQLHEQPRRHGTALADLGLQGEPGHVAGDDVRLVPVDVGVHHLGHPRVPDPAQRGHLAAQPGPGVGVVGDVRAQHLDRHRAPVRVEAEMHDPHAALTQALHQAVDPERDAQRLGR